MQRISITLPDDIAEIINVKVSKGERSKFIADALKEALHKKERMIAYDALENFTPFKTNEDSTEVLRKIRTSKRD